MPRKKSIKKAATAFDKEAAEVLAFVTACSGQSKDHVSLIHDYAVIRLYRSFEVLMLDALVGAVNNDTSTISSRTGIRFPKHLTDEVCEYLLVGDGFFDFRGRDGLIRILKEFVPDDHYLVDVVKQPKYKSPLEHLSALRNFASHGSRIAKARAREAVGSHWLGSAGSWLKKKGRIEALVQDLRSLAAELKDRAPY